MKNKLCDDKDPACFIHPLISRTWLVMKFVGPDGEMKMSSALFKKQEKRFY